MQLTVLVAAPQHDWPVGTVVHPHLGLWVDIIGEPELVTVERAVDDLDDITLAAFGCQPERCCLGPTEKAVGESRRLIGVENVFRRLDDVVGLAGCVADQVRKAKTLVPRGRVQQSSSPRVPVEDRVPVVIWVTVGSVIDSVTRGCDMRRSP